MTLQYGQLLFVLIGWIHPGVARGTSTAHVQVHPSYFDLIRRQTGLNVEHHYDRSSIHRVLIDKETSFQLAEVKTYLPFSNGTHIRNTDVFNDAFAALLSVWHFNNIDKSPILSKDEIKECAVKLTMEILDTQFSPTETTKSFTSILKQPPTMRNPPPTAVVGAYRSAVSSPLAILTGVKKIPQVSWAAAAADFDSKAQYPMFGRTVASSTGEARAALKFFQTMQSTHIAVVFMTVSL